MANDSERREAPQVVLVAAAWQSRALIRAQLIEDGFDVVATDTWPMARRWLRPGSKPRLVIVDLEELPDAERVLHDLSALMKPHRVLVLTGIGTVSPAEIERLGFQAVRRPVAIEHVVQAAAAIVRSQASDKRRTAR